MIAVDWSRLSTISFSSTGTPTLASLAPISATIAATTRPLYAHRYGISLTTTRQLASRPGFAGAGRGSDRLRASRMAYRVYQCRLKVWRLKYGGDGAHRNVRRRCDKGAVCWARLGASERCARRAAAGRGLT